MSSFRQKNQIVKCTPLCLRSCEKLRMYDARPINIGRQCHKQPGTVIADTVVCWGRHGMFRDTNSASAAASFWVVATRLVSGILPNWSSSSPLSPDVTVHKHEAHCFAIRQPLFQRPPLCKDQVSNSDLAADAFDAAPFLFSSIFPTLLAPLAFTECSRSRTALWACSNAVTATHATLMYLIQPFYGLAMPSLRFATV